MAYLCMSAPRRRRGCVARYIAMHTAPISLPEAKPFVKWAGGKRRLLPLIDRALPPGFALMRGITYVEPFVGGGAVLFHLLRAYPHTIERAIVNAINPRLMAAYRAVKHEPDALVKLLRHTQHCYEALPTDEARKDYFMEARRRFNSGLPTDVERAATLIFLNRTCFNGLYRVNSRGDFNVAFGRYARPLICDEATLRADSRLLQRVELACGDFEATEERIPAGSMVYIDPPYRPLSPTASFTAYAAEGFGDDDQRRLKRFADRLTARQCRVMLSNSDGQAVNADDRFIATLYADYHLHHVETVRSVSANAQRRGRCSELLITNYATGDHLASL